MAMTNALYQSEGHLSTETTNTKRNFRTVYCVDELGGEIPGTQNLMLIQLNKGIFLLLY